MPEPVQDIYLSILAKVKVVIDRQNMLVEQIEAERAENRALRADLKRLQADLRRLQADNVNLTVANHIAPTREKVAESKAVLSGLVRDIDRCIAELTALHV
jgi:small-conductance mechanosensitive channel